MSIDYTEKIPNNVDLAGDASCSARLESWQPNFLNWWKTMARRCRPRTSTCAPRSTSAGRAGALRPRGDGRVPLGVFLAERNADRRIAFGEQKGEAVWQQCPASTGRPAAADRHPG